MARTNKGTSGSDSNEEEREGSTPGREVRASEHRRGKGLETGCAAPHADEWETREPATGTGYAGHPPSRSPRRLRPFSSSLPWRLQANAASCSPPAQLLSVSRDRSSYSTTETAELQEKWPPNSPRPFTSDHSSSAFCDWTQKDECWLEKMAEAVYPGNQR